MSYNLVIEDEDAPESDRNVATATSDRVKWFAHTPPFEGGPWHAAECHTLGVNRIALRLAFGLGLDYEVQVVTLLHDLGKYGIHFQLRLQGKERHVDHWTIGAWVAYKNFNSPESALVIQGHHIGLQSGARQSLRELDPIKYLANSYNTRHLSEIDAELLLNRLQADGIVLPGPQPFVTSFLKPSARMLRTRVLFSILTDADFLDTESHFARRDHGPKVPRAEGPTFDVDRAIAALDDFRSRLQTPATDWVKALRDEVSEACADKADLPVGIFTLTAPTGSGKTLAMLRFALLHAKRHELRRVIIVLPFLNLIEQTASIYRAIFRDFPPNFVLEDHSLARDDGQEEEGAERSTKLLTENWDAPIVITTNVRFFEALHHNRPSVCRKLHRIAQSVVICDEVQTLPVELPNPKNGKEFYNLVLPTLSTLTSLSREFKTTVVFATATQPAFGYFNASMKRISDHEWRPTEILPNVADAFERSVRVSTDWRPNPQSWEEVADEISRQPGTLAIVNTRKDAARLATLIRDIKPSAKIYHLSTNMCVGHRQAVLEKVRSEGVEADGFLIATQCVEAGVDLDFPQVYRAWAPLDSIAQAAGRCNRNGRLERGRVVVFLPEAARYPPGYEMGKDAALAVIESREPRAAELHDPSLFQEFFQELYWAKGAGVKEDLLEEAIRAQNYVEVAKLYHLIPDAGINVVIRIGQVLGPEAHAKSEELLDELEKSGLSRKLMAKLRPFTIGTFQSTVANLGLTKLKTPQGETVPNWVLMNVPGTYHEDFGLLTNEPFDAMII